MGEAAGLGKALKRESEEYEGRGGGLWPLTTCGGEMTILDRSCRIVDADVR